MTFCRDKLSVTLILNQIICGIWIFFILPLFNSQSYSLFKDEKTQTKKNNSEQRERNYKCDICKTILPTFKDYHKHVSDNSDCKKDYLIVVSFVLILDMSLMDSKSIFNAKLLVINSIKKKK